MQFSISNAKEEMGKRAADTAAQLLRSAICQNGSARLLLATGASQIPFFEAILREDVDWSKVEMFHLDEYIALPPSHPASFRRYLAERFVSKVSLKAAYLIDGEGNPADVIANLQEVLAAAPIDVALVGFGENAHIAFNDPPADFNANASYMVVELDERCKAQQVSEGWFHTLGEVPSQAITMTVAQIMKSKAIISVVPGANKAQALRDTLCAPAPDQMIPATILQGHPCWYLYADREAASLLPQEMTTAVELKQYRQILAGTFDKILGEYDFICKAADILAEAVASGGLINVVGTGGHSTMAAEELLWRAGGLAAVNALLDPGLTLVHGAKRSNVVERTEGYGLTLFDNYNLGRTEGEVLIIVNAYGINAMTIDMALEAKRRGMKTIGITSRSFADTVPQGVKSRHSSGKNLYEIVDVFVNCHLPYGDAVIPIEGVSQKVAPTSTFCNSFTLHCVMIETVKKLLELGAEPPVWMSANLPGGDEANKRWEEQYMPRVKHL